MSEDSSSKHTHLSTMSQSAVVSSGLPCKVKLTLFRSRLKLSHMHPRLLHTVILMEPIIQNQLVTGPNAAMRTTFRPDLWPSRAEASSALTRSKFFSAFDPRALNAYTTYGLRETPTAVYPSQVHDGADTPVTLTTTKHQEAWSYMRSTFTPWTPDWNRELLLQPDLDPTESEEVSKLVFHRTEIGEAMRNLPFVRPSVMWLFGAHSHINTPPLREEKVRVTGTGVGGNGGAERGRVKGVVINAGHMVCMEKIAEVADECARWYAQEVDIWRKEEEFWKGYNSGKSERDGLVLSKQWMEAVKQPATALRKVKEKL